MGETDAGSRSELEKTVELGVTTPTVFTVDELAALLRVNRKTVYDSIKRRELPGVRRIGTSIRIHRDSVLRWLEAGGTLASPSQGRVSRSRRNP